MRRVFFVTVFLVLISGGYSFGQEKVGTAGAAAAQFLKIGVGARAVGMGEALVAATEDAAALYWNPAGIALLDKIHVSFTHTEWIADLSHDFYGVTYPLKAGVVGVSLTFLNMGEIEITTREQPDGTGSFYDASDMALGLSFARRLTDRFSVGLTAKYIRQKIYNETASGFALDLGGLLYVGTAWGLKLGMCLSNYGTNMRMEGEDLIVPWQPGGGEFPVAQVRAMQYTDEWPLPTNFKVGIAMDLMGGNNTLFPSKMSHVILAIDGNHPNDTLERGNVGLEYTWNDMISGRIGYKYNYSEQGLTYGGGANLNMRGTSVKVDYALARFGMLDNVHRLSVELAF